MENFIGKNKLLINPKTNTFSFGKIPEIRNKKYIFQGGEIYLRQGEHRGINNGFGVEHIWEEHKKELIKSGYKTIEDIPKFVSEIICQNSPIYYDFSKIGRVSVVALSTKGLVHLDERQDEKNEVFYSIVTAYSVLYLPKTKLGVKIGYVIY